MNDKLHAGVASGLLIAGGAAIGYNWWGAIIVCYGLLVLLIAGTEEKEMHTDAEHAYDRIRPQIIDFYRKRVAQGQRDFRLVDLFEFVTKKITIAPNSAARIMQYLRREGRLDYEVLNRRKSLYRILWYRDDGDDAPREQTA